MSDNKIIFGFVGLIASGKGTAAAHLQEHHGASTHKFSTMLWDALDRFYLDRTRDNLIKISESIRGTFGEDIMAKVIAEDVKNDPNSLIVVDGIRRLADIQYLKQFPGFTLVEISADTNTRYERLIRRSEKADDATKTYEQFLADHKRSTEISIPEVAAHARERIDNNGTAEDLGRELDLLIKKYVK